MHSQTLTSNECFVMAGKFGDVINVLGLLYLRWMQTGEPSKLIISKRYASICDGLEYIEPIIFDGEFDELSRAITQAKRDFSRVIPLQVYGKDFPFDKRHHSFAIDQWARGGSAHLWGTINPQISTSFDGSDFTSAILVADKSESSPFPQIAKLIARLKSEFPDKRVIPLSQVKLPKLQHMVAVMDSASLLIATETSHLHLSAASKVPTIAIATDKPSPWHGTAQRPGLVFHCRYSDYEFREDELFREAKRAVNNLGTIPAKTIQTKHPHGYNMGLLDVDNSMLLSYRYHPDQKNWRTNLAIIEARDGKTVESEVVIPGTESRSVEDARLFMFKDRPHMAYTVSDSFNGMFRGIQAYGELERVEEGWRIKKHLNIKRAGNDFSRIEKNWAPFVSGGRLYFIYGMIGKSQVVLEVDGDKVVQEHKSPAPEWKWGQIRGGVILGGMPRLRLFHSRVGDGQKHFTFRYYIGASLMSPEPPFQTEAVSRFPVYAGHEEWTPNCPHWKPNCALVYGARLVPGGVEASVGINDSRCAVLKLKSEDLNL